MKYRLTPQKLKEPRFIGRRTHIQWQKGKKGNKHKARDRSSASHKRKPHQKSGGVTHLQSKTL